MAVVVFDADVLIGYLERTDAQHAAAVKRMKNALGAGTRRLVSAVNYSELLIRPLQKRGEDGAAIVDAMLVGLGIETIPVSMALARRAASVRARTKLTLPDAFAIATALDAGRSGQLGVRVESFDKRVTKAFAALRRTS